MKKSLVIFLCIFISISSYAKKSEQPDKSEYPVNLDNCFIRFDFSKSTGSAFYNNEGKLTTEIYKPLTVQHDTVFTFNRDSYFYKLDISQMLKIDSINEIGAELCFGYTNHSLEQKYRSFADSLDNIQQDYDNSLFEYLDITAKYRGKFGKFILDANAKFSIPLSEEVNIKDTTDYRLTTGGFSIITPSLDLYYIGEKAYFSLSGAYSIISGEKSDMYKIGIGVGLLSVENAVLHADLQYCKSTDAIDAKYRFLPIRYQFQEEYFKIGIGFKLMFKEALSAGIKYDLVLSGKNTLNNNIINAYIAYSIDFFNSKKTKK